jgi:glycine oxidase
LPDLRGVRGEVVVVRSPDVSLQRPVRLLHPRIPLYIVPRGNGLFMIGATMIESERRGPVSVRSAVELLNAAYALHPAFGEAEIVELGSDLRPAFPDNLPDVRRSGHVLHANGLFRHGFLLAPALARRTAEAVLSMLQPETNHADLPQRRRA